MKESERLDVIIPTKRKQVPAHLELVTHLENQKRKAIFKRD